MGFWCEDMKKYDNELSKRINANIDADYAKFHSALILGKEIKGVRIPVLRQIAKEFAVYEDFLQNVSLNSYENISIVCYYIGLTCKDYSSLQPKLDFILPYIDNWAICDTFVSSLKCLKKDSENNFIPVIYDYLQCGQCFANRFAIVTLMTYYLKNGNLIEEIFNKIIVLQNADYYIDMAIAWLVSMAFVKDREVTLNLLKSNKLHPFVQNKSISKICDSFRVSKEDKEFVKTLRVKVA